MRKMNDCNALVLFDTRDAKAFHILAQNHVIKSQYPGTFETLVFQREFVHRRIGFLCHLRISRTSAVAGLASTFRVSASPRP